MDESRKFTNKWKSLKGRRCKLLLWISEYDLTDYANHNLTDYDNHDLTDYEIQNFRRF